MISANLLSKAFGSRIQSRAGDERGMALAIAMVLLAMLAFLGSAALLTTSTEMDIAANERTYQMAFYAADGGNEVAIRVVRDALALNGQPDYGYDAGVVLDDSLYDNLLASDGEVDWDDVQVAALGEVSVGVAVDRDSTLPVIPVGGQLPEPGSGYGGEKATFNYFYDLDSQSDGPRNAASRIACTYKCAYDGSGCLRDD